MGQLKDFIPQNCDLSASHHIPKKIVEYLLSVQDTFEEKVKAWLDYPLFYDIHMTSIFFVFLVNGISPISLDSTVVFPNPILFVLVFLSLILLTWARNSRNSYDLTRNDMVLIFALSLFPPFLFIFLAVKWIQKQKEKGNPFELYAGAYLIIIILITFSVLVLTILLISFGIAPNKGPVLLRIIYLATLGPLGLVGFVVGNIRKISFPQERRLFIQIFFLLFWLIVIMIGIPFSPYWI